MGADHRTLSTYLAMLRRHGLWLDELTEPPPQAGWDPAHEADRQPVFLVARCVRLPSWQAVPDVSGQNRLRRVVDLQDAVLHHERVVLLALVGHTRGKWRDVPVHM